MGHEIGYHYETLVDASGNFEKATILFRKCIAQFRGVTQVLRPLKNSLFF